MKSSKQLAKAHRSGSFHRLLFESHPANGGDAWKRSLSFSFMQLVVLIIRSITPLSYLFLFLLWYFYPLSNYFQSKVLFYGLTIWSIAEAVFFLYYFHLFNVLNISRSPLRHKVSDQEERLRLMKSCFGAMKQSRGESVEPHMHLRKVVEGWFLGMPIEKIKFDNMAAWTAWAFFGHDVADLRQFELQENRELIAEMEKELRFKFTPGCNEEAHSIRLTLDPLFATQRPLFFYSVIFVVNQLSYVALALLGYRRRSGLGADALGVDRVASPSGKFVEAETLSLYHRPADGSRRGAGASDGSHSGFNGYGQVNGHANGYSNVTAIVHNGHANTIGGSQLNGHSQSSNPATNGSHSFPSRERPLPIVFVHGIGIGFAHYLGLIWSLPTDTDVYLLEWPHVSMQLSSLVPSIEHTVRSLVRLLDSDGHEKACFLTHSLGSTAVSWLLHDDKAKSKVGATVMLDPVTFLLCDPTVASSFIHREPESTFEFLVHFFVARELHVANALSRHFSWSHNILFAEEMPRKGVEKGVPNSIFLSSRDGIIPTDAVVRYLEAQRVTGSAPGVETLVFDGTHGEMMLHPRWVRAIAKKVREKVYGSVNY